MSEGAQNDRALYTCIEHSTIYDVFNKRFKGREKKPC